MPGRPSTHWGAWGTPPSRGVGAVARPLHAAGKMAQPRLHEPEATEEHLDQLRQLRAAVTRLENMLGEELYEV